MNNLLSETKYLVQKCDLSPQRKSGQNFLIDRNILQKIIQTADLTKDDKVLEIGSGFGTLTKELASRVKKVWAVELEKRFITPLNKLSFTYPAIEVIKKDILKTDVNRLVGKDPYKVVANLPYNITSLVLRRFLEQGPKPRLMVLLLQKEVAERIIAKPGDLSLLAVSVQFFGKPKIIQTVGKKNFWPVPKVDSAILRIENIKTSRINSRDFFRVVRSGFSAKRKQIHNNLANSFHISNEKIKRILEQLKLDYRARPQDLSLANWEIIVVALKQEGIL